MMDVLNEESKEYKTNKKKARSGKLKDEVAIKNSIYSENRTGGEKVVKRYRTY